MTTLYGKRERYDAAQKCIQDGLWEINVDNGTIHSNYRMGQKIGTVRDGYMRVAVPCDDGQYRYVSAHRVIWEYVYGPSDLNLTINHKDGNGLNNKIGNLELATNAENQIHSMRVLGRGLGSRNKGTSNAMAKLNEDAIKEIRHRLSNGEPLYSLAERFNVNITTISAIKRRDTWDWVEGKNDKCSSCPDHQPIRPPLPVGAKGEHASKAKLTDEDVYIIRQRYDQGETPLSISKNYPVSPSSICNIGARRTWKHL